MSAQGANRAGFSNALAKDEIVIEVPEAKDGTIRRKWKADIDFHISTNISQARDKYVNYLKKTNGTANKEVWQVYDHLTTDIFNDCMRELMGKIDKDLDTYCEKVIYDEF